MGLMEVTKMPEIFPYPIRKLPRADIPMDGLEAYLSQGKDHQILFMRFEKDVDVPEHTHGDQWEIVLEGKVDVRMENNRFTYEKGDRFYIPGGIKHSARVHGGYASMIFFDQKDRYGMKTNE